MLYAGSFCDTAWLKLSVEIIVALGLYIGGNRILHSKVQADVLSFVLGRRKNLV